jgi:hypothetical protein
MIRAPYPAAGIAARQVYPHFAHITHGRAAPDIETIEELLDVAFWASLRREEGYSPQISLAYVDPSQVQHPLRFGRAIPLAADALTRLAPAVERPGIHLGACRDDDNALTIWGATRELPANSFVIEVIAPGLLLIKDSLDTESSKFMNVAVLEGDQIKIIDQGSSTADCSELLNSLLSLQSQTVQTPEVSMLVQLAISMRAHHRGGSLLVVPPRSDTWRESILQPIKYEVDPPFAGLAELMQIDVGENPRRSWHDELRRAVDGIAGLTAVDGCTIISEDYYLLGFGAKIVRRSGASQVPRVLLTEPIEGIEANITEPGSLGGTRHLSAAQFAHDQQNAIALVASQDGRFTVFGWSPCEQLVHAHRIESLLL